MSHRQQLYPTHAIVVIDRPDAEGASSVIIRYKLEPHGHGYYRSTRKKVWEGARGSHCGDDPACIEAEIEAWRRSGAEVELTDLRVEDQSRNGMLETPC